MSYQSTWRQTYAGAKMAAVAGVVAFGLASAPSADAATITGTLAGFENGATVIALPGQYDFQSKFDELADLGTTGSYAFQFQNQSASSIAITLLGVSITQIGSRFFDQINPDPDKTAVITDFDGQTITTDTKESDGFNLSTVVAPLGTIWLAFDWGAVNQGTFDGKITGPHIDFLVEASVVPLPAALVLFLSGLAGIGFLGRYNAKRREPELV
jgi:hypothetical protein